MLSRFFKWYFVAPKELYSWGDVIVWWEVRRIPYNLIVGLAGIVSLPLYFLFLCLADGIKPGEDAIEPMALIVAPIVIPIVINIAYTAGWMVELILYIVRRKYSPAIGPALLVLGLSFSLFVIFFPSVVWCVAWICKSQ
jgi:hypothetical protein